MRKAKHVVLEFGFTDTSVGGTSKVRIASYYYDNAGHRVYDRTWAIGSKNPCCNPTYVTLIVTDKWNDYFGSIPVTPVVFVTEVIGSGYLYMSRIGVDY